MSAMLAWLSQNFVNIFCQPPQQGTLLHVCPPQVPAWGGMVLAGCCLRPAVQMFFTCKITFHEVQLPGVTEPRQDFKLDKWVHTVLKYEFKLVWL